MNIYGFAEFTDGDGRSVLVNPSKVIVVRDETKEVYASITVDGNIKINVRQSFEEIKKRLGMQITPRAETLALR
jgi:hypothetical protein